MANQITYGNGSRRELFHGVNAEALVSEIPEKKKSGAADVGDDVR